MAKITELGVTNARVQSNVVRNGASKGTKPKNEWVVDVAFRDAEGNVRVSDAWYRNRKDCPALAEMVQVRLYTNGDYKADPKRIFVDVIDIEGI